MKMNRGVLCGGGVALMVLTLSCGKSDQSSKSNPVSRSQSEAMLQVGDQVRGVLQQSNGARATSFETLTQVVSISDDGLQYLIEKSQIKSSRRSLQASGWKSRDELLPLHFQSLEDLTVRCPTLRGVMLELDLATGEKIQACRVVSQWSNVDAPGAGETWLGVVPFGVVKQRWVSHDRQKRYDFEVLSYVRNGEHHQFLNRSFY